MIVINNNMVSMQGDAETITAEFSVICGAMVSELLKMAREGTTKKQVKKLVKDLCKMGCDEWLNFDMDEKQQPKRKYQRKTTSGVVFNDL